MPSKPKTKSRAGASTKRASLPRESSFANSFKKDWERYDKAGRTPMDHIKTAMSLIIANDGPLPQEYQDHPLKGDMTGYRDCHVHGDLLLIYQITGAPDAEKVVFTAIGTHAELFKGK